jgi:hypothetical protein
MSRFARFIDALHESREREAARVVSRHQHLIAEARDYERHCASAIAETRADEVAPRPAMRLATGRAS